MSHPLEQLRNYQPQLTREPDFEDFWRGSLQDIHLGKKKHLLNMQLKEYPYPLGGISVRQVIIKATDDTPLCGWYLTPKEADRPVPGLIRFHGYSSNKGKLCELLLWALQGYAVLAMDVRGQTGDTPDPRVYEEGSFSGWLTRGLNAPQEYYYRQVYVDAVQQVEALARRPEVDETHIGLFGNSQGAALAAAAAALSGRIAAVGLGTPFLSDIKKAYAEHQDGPWQELGWYFRMYDPLHLREADILRVLSYFDIMNFAPWLTCPAAISIGLKDAVCPPATIFAFSNHLAGKKELYIYPDYGHENIDSFTDQLIPFFAEQLLSASYR